MLGRRRRRWPNIEPTLGQRLMFTGDKQHLQQTTLVIPAKITCWYLVELYAIVEDDGPPFCQHIMPFGEPRGFALMVEQNNN